MSSASKEARSERAEISRTEQAPADGIGIISRNGLAPKAVELPSVRRMRETSTDVVNALGLMALAVLDSADVVGRTAGRIARDGLRDAAHGTQEVVQELSQVWHDSVVELARTLVDTGLDANAQFVRGTQGLSRQGREVIGAVQQLAQGLVGATIGVMTAAPRKEPKEPAKAVPVVIN